MTGVRLRRTWGRRRSSDPRPARTVDRSLSDMFSLALLVWPPLAILARLALPAKYSFDSDALQRIAIGSYLPLEDPSFVRVGMLYRALGLTHRPALAGALGVGLAVITLWSALRRARQRATLPVYLLVGLYVVTSCAYLSQYSKDVWVFPVVLVVLLARPGWWGELEIIAATSVYAALLREYWFLVLLLYLALRLATLPGLRRRLVLVGLVAAVATSTVAAPFVLGQPVQAFRESVNVDRELSADATTLISTPDLGAGTVSQVVENAIVVVELVVPVPLLTEGSPIYAVYAFAILMVWVVFGRRVFRGPGRVLDGAPARTTDTRLVRCVLFALAFVTIQGMFEPDYGSYLRHLTPVIPLIISAVVGRPATGLASAVQLPDFREERATVG